MKSLLKYALNFLLIVVVWVGVAIPITARIYFVEQGGKGGDFLELFLSQLPGWLLWAIVTPLILLIARFFPFKKGRIKWIALLLVVFSFAIAAIYAGGFAVMDALLSGSPLKTQPLLDASFAHLQNHWLYILAIYWIVLAAAYGLRPAFVRKPIEKEGDFENAILIKTNYGYVLVEIERFQFVKDGGRRIMFHTTGRNRHLDRKRTALAKGKLVDQKRYRADRRIVIDLGKIRSAEQTAPGRFIFHIGYSHELHFNDDYFRKLGGWLPAPIITYNY